MKFTNLHLAIVTVRALVESWRRQLQLFLSVMSILGLSWATLALAEDEKIMIIKKDTVWETGQKLTLKRDIQIQNGATLTIKPGVTVFGRNHRIDVEGKLQVFGSTVKPTFIHDLHLDYLGLLDEARPRIELSGVFVHGGSFIPAGGSSVFGSFGIYKSVIEGWNLYQYVWYPEEKSELFRSFFLNCPEFKLLSRYEDISIKYNTFSSYREPAIEVRARYNDPGIIIFGNSFLSSDKVVLSTPQNYSYADFDARYNWFGTDDYRIIKKMILDRKDDLSRAPIKVRPYLNAADPRAPYHGSDEDERHVGSARDDIVYGAAGKDRLAGRNGADRLLGADGRDKLSGQSGRDYLDGGPGNDRLNGGPDKDYLVGGPGSDKFILAVVADSETGASDIIADFEQDSDQIDLSKIDADIVATGHQQFEFIGSKKFSSKPGELRFRRQDREGEEADRTVVAGDVDGDGLSDFAIHMKGIYKLTGDDFIFGTPANGKIQASLPATL